MTNTNSDYRSFLLRLWIERENDGEWRFSLEDTRTGKRKAFANIEKLIAYLNETINNEKQSSRKNNDLEIQIEIKSIF